MNNWVKKLRVKFKGMGFCKKNSAISAKIECMWIACDVDAMRYDTIVSLFAAWSWKDCDFVGSSNELRLSSRQSVCCHDFISFLLLCLLYKTFHVVFAFVVQTSWTRLKTTNPIHSYHLMVNFVRKCHLVWFCYFSINISLCSKIFSKIVFDAEYPM